MKGTREARMRNIAILAIAVIAFSAAASLASADTYHGTNRNNSTRITIYTEMIKPVKGVRVGKSYIFELFAPGTDETYAYMCIKVSRVGKWTCRDTIASGTLEARMWDEFGTAFRITPRMVIDGSLTVRALGILKDPLVTRTVPVVR
jgi:hypothetical protein